jgi:excinuclease ABC subunit C
MLERPRDIPSESGCYLFRNERGSVIYVGKARSLSQRLSNYFARLDGLDPKTQTLMVEAESLEWIVTGTEVDALILENELIKTHQPRYNMRLKDDKSFPFLALDFRSEWPRPYTTRGAHHRNVTYYGPFAHVAPLKRTIDELLQAYPLRSCNEHKFAQHERMGRPCLLFDVKKCSGPCIGAVSKEDYEGYVSSFGEFFEGHAASLRQRLESTMADAASARNYEGAARARDGLVALERAADTQRIVLDERSDLDAISVETSGSRAAVAMFKVRSGRVIGRTALLLDLSFDEGPADILERAIGELYGPDGELVGTIAVAERSIVSDLAHSLLERWRGRRIELVEPRRGARRELLEMVREDALEVLRVDSLRRAADHNVRSRALLELSEALRLPRPPYRIECFDMSHLQGTSYVGSMVVFEDALARKSAYRHFNVRSVLGNDDVGAMREVVRRRFAHWNDAGGDEGFANPDLVIIDGGVPQLSAARAALADAGVPAGAVELCALAKREELIFRPGRDGPVVLERGSESLYLVQRVRDEAHRFAISFHRSKRGRAMVASALDGVRGLGADRRDRVMAHFGSIDDVRRASVDELAKVPGLPRTVAESLYDHLHRPASAALAREGHE